MQELARVCCYSSAMPRLPVKDNVQEGLIVILCRDERPRSPWMTRLPDVLGRGVVGERDGWRAAEGSGGRCKEVGCD